MRIRTIVPLMLGVIMVATACGSGASQTTTVPTTATATVDEVSSTTTAASTSTTSSDPAFPVTVEVDSGPVTIDEMPTRIVSLSPTATETLFAVGAGDQVVAVDEYSYYPPEAPVTDLSGFTPNVEAILSYSPDLLVIAGSPDDLQAAIEAVGIPVMLMDSAATLDDAYAQIEALGLASGHGEEASTLVAEMQDRIAAVVDSIPTGAASMTFYHELDPTFYTVTSQTFIGQIYQLLGLVNIADDGDPDGYGFPQLSEEFIINADPDVIFLADAQCCGASRETVAARPGWSAMGAVTSGRVFPVDADIASRWGPRTAEFVEAVGAVMIGDGGG
ncbi:MAG: ABC transporter substrate-binding protein [Acidimicrobiia bacterium]|nr:ABC transporter substrate-binding protein [Acidimicrobiia bacterium]